MQRVTGGRYYVCGCAAGGDVVRSVGRKKLILISRVMVLICSWRHSGCW